MRFRCGSILNGLIRHRGNKINCLVLPWRDLIVYTTFLLKYATLTSVQPSGSEVVAYNHPETDIGPNLRN